MPQHNHTKYVKENSHFYGLKSIEYIDNEYECCNCNVCGEWTCNIHYFMYCDDNRLFCWRCFKKESRERPTVYYYNFQIVGLLLLDCQSISEFPHFQFGDWRQVIAPNFTAQYLVVMNREVEELYLIPLKKNGYWVESKDLIRLDSEFLYDEHHDGISEINCKVSRDVHWKIILETMKIHWKQKGSKFFKQKKKQLCDEFYELNVNYNFNSSTQIEYDEEDPSEDEEDESYTDEESLDGDEEESLDGDEEESLEGDEEESLEGNEEEQLEQDSDSDIETSFPISDRLILYCYYSRQAKSETFQGFMINELRWHVIDSEERSNIRQVYPVVYPLANETEPLDLSFKLKRNWKNFNNSITKIDSCFSGDLNGGYSDKIIYQLGKNGNTISEDDIIKYAPSAITISDLQHIGEPIITGFRPFHSNPDLFQVQLVFSKFTKSAFDVNVKMGFMFSFQFKIVEEFTQTKERLFETLRSNLLTDCNFKFQ